MKKKLTDLFDVAGVAAISTGLGLRFGLWLALVVAGALIIAANWIRA